MEEWKDVVGYEGFYQVSDKGRVKSLDRVDCLGHARKGIILKQRVTKWGYMRTMLYKNGVSKQESIHRLVGKAFIPNIENKEQINHIDGVKTNNSVFNLEWCSLSENRKHAYRTGLQHPQIGEANGFSKLKEWQVREIREIYKRGGYTKRELGRKYGVCAANVGMIINNKIWKNI